MNAFPERGFASVDGWSGLTATGPDAAAFLQNLCTNDVLRLADGDACEAMFTDAKAHVIAYGWVARRAADDFAVLLASSRADELLAHLDRYLIRERVELAIEPGDGVLLGAGLSGLIDDATAVRVDAFGEGVLAVLAPQIDRTAAMQPLLANGRRLIEPDEFAAIRVRLGVPLDGVDVDRRNLPQEVDRNERAISFTKGCYLGQEPVARIDALGRVNQLLRGLTVDGPPPAAGDELVSGAKTVGRVTSGAASEGGAVALAYVRREHAEAGSPVTVGGKAAVVRVLPVSGG